MDGKFDEARRLVRSLITNKNPDTQDAADQYCLLFDDLINNQPDQMLLRNAEVSHDTTDIDPDLWIDQACVWVALGRFKREGKRWWEAFGWLVLSGQVGNTIVPGLPEQKPWLRLRECVGGLAVDLRGGGGEKLWEELRAVVGVKEWPKPEHFTISVLERAWSKIRKQWRDALLVARPGDLNGLRAAAANLAYKDDKKAFNDVINEILRRHPGHFATSILALGVLGRGDTFERAQSIRRDLLKYHSSRIEQTEFSSELEVLGEAALFLDDWAKARRCCERMGGMGEPWFVGDWEYPTLEMGRLLGLVEEGEAVRVAQSLLCASADGQLSGCDGLLWALSRVLEGTGEVATACAILAIIQDQNQAFKDKARKLAAGLGAKPPGSVLKRVRRETMRRLEWGQGAGGGAETRRLRLLAKRRGVDGQEAKARFGEASALLAAHPMDVESVLVVGAVVARVFESVEGDVDEVVDVVRREAEQTARALVASIDFILEKLPMSAYPMDLLLKIGSECHPEAVGRLGFTASLLASNPDDDEARKTKAQALLELKRYGDLRGEVEALCATASMWDDDYVDKLLKAQKILENIPLNASDHQAVARLLADEDEDDEQDDEQEEENTEEDSEDEGKVGKPGATPSPSEPEKYKSLREIRDGKQERVKQETLAPAPSSVPKIIAYVSLLIIILIWLMAR